MNNILRDIRELDDTIRQMQKMESKMRAGQWIDAWRDCNRVIASLEKNKSEILRSSAGQNSDN